MRYRGRGGYKDKNTVESRAKDKFLREEEGRWSSVTSLEKVRKMERGRKVCVSLCLDSNFFFNSV